MLKVELKKINELGSTKQEVSIKILLNIPLVTADIFTGFFFSNAPNYVLSELIISFADMKKMMKFHSLKDWQEVRTHIEHLYTQYFKTMNNFSMYVRILKEDDPLNNTSMAAVKVFFKIPQLTIEEEKGFTLLDTPTKQVAGVDVLFSDMHKVMKHHQITKWIHAKEYLERKYIEFFEQIFQDWVSPQHA